ncbi:MAG: CotH kinase family protein [Eubacteriales bacterium]|nr:CotH kinase family protein [Eubacteriales bacterium]
MAWKWSCRIALVLIATALLVSCSGYPPVATSPVDTMPGQTLSSSQATTEYPSTGQTESETLPGTPSSTVEATPPATQPSAEAPALLEINTGLPVLYIDVDLAAVYKDKDEYQKGALSLWQDRDDSASLAMGPFDMELKGRGNSSWQDAKRSFHLQLESKMNLLGLGENKHWLLLGQSSDLTLMKNKLFYDLSGEMGLVYMQSTWVELVINNQHAGNYLLCEKINHSDNLALPTGLIYELDTNYDEDYRFKTISGQPIMLHTHKYLDALDEVTLESIQARLQAFETAVSSADFATAVDGQSTRYSEMIDMESLVDYWLIQELAFNPSIFKNSTFFYQESLDSVYQMGPVWDMDQSTGDLEQQYPGHDRWASILWGDLTHLDSQTRAWHKYFIHDPVFIAAAHQAYWDNRDRFAELVSENGTLFQMREQLLPSAILNYQIWQDESNPEEAKDDYKDLVRSLKGWLTGRISWLDRQFESVESLENSLGNGGF